MGPETCADFPICGKRIDQGTNRERILFPLLDPLLKRPGYDVTRVVSPGLVQVVIRRPLVLPSKKNEASSGEGTPGKDPFPPPRVPSRAPGAGKQKTPLPS